MGQITIVARLPPGAPVELIAADADFAAQPARALDLSSDLPQQVLADIDLPRAWKTCC